MSLIQMSVSGGIMILAVTAVRFLAINRLPKRVFLLLWGAVLIRLLIPFSVPSALSAYTVISRNFPMQGETSAAGIFLQEEAELPAKDQPYGTGGIYAADKLDSAERADGAEESDSAERTGGAESVHGIKNMLYVETDERMSALSVWHIVWIVGVTACGIFFAASYICCYLEFRTSLPIRYEAADGWLKEHRLKRIIQIRESDRILTPLTYGILHPVILMPKNADWDDREQLQYILQHEYNHIRRFDTVLKLVAVFALCIHWFNPAVWMMYFLLNRDIEISCDECVVRQFGEASKTAYARTLIAMKEKQSGLTPFYSNFSKSVMEERVTAIMKTKKVTVWAIIISVLILAAIVVLFATSAANNPDGTLPDKSGQALDSTQNVQNEAEKLFPRETDLSFADLNFALSASYEEEAVMIAESSGEIIRNIILPVSDTWEVYLYMENESSGYLLCCGSPAAGMMTKLLYVTDDRWSTYSEKDISFQIDGYPTSISVSPEGDIYIGTQMRSNGYMFVSEDEGDHWNTIRTDDGQDREDGYYRWGYAPFFDRENQLAYVILEYDGCYYLYRSDEERKEWESAGRFSLSELHMMEKYWISEHRLYIVDSEGNSYQFDFG